MGVEALWAVQAKRSVMTCVLHVEPTFTELVVMQDQDIAARQTFPSQNPARAHAKDLHDRLIKIGWRDAS